MALISGLKKDWVESYDGWDSQIVGVGTADPNVYATRRYAKKKTQKLLIGGITKCIYAGFEHDARPTILSIAYEPKYNTVLAYNLRYLPEKTRLSMVDFVLKQNRVNIKNKKTDCG